MTQPSLIIPTEPQVPDPLAAELDRLREGNQVLLKRLLGHNAQLDPVGVVMVRLGALIDAIFDPVGRAQFELKFETDMATTLQQALDEVRKARLLAPASPAGPMPGSGLIVPGHP